MISKPKVPKPPKPPPPPPSIGDPGVQAEGRFLRFAARKGGFAGTVFGGRSIAKHGGMESAVTTAPSSVRTS